MDLTIHLLTKNNQRTIEKTLLSVQPLHAPVVVADRGSTDGTIRLCQEYGTKIVRVPYMTRCEARNHVLSPNGWNLYIEPWETLSMGHQEVLKAKRGAYRFTVVKEGTIAKEVRLWFGDLKFINPVFEYLNVQTNLEIQAVIHSKGAPNYQDTIQEIEAWKVREPTIAEPFYYQACLLLSEGKHEEFLKIAEHYMFLDKETSVASTMIRYYYALVQTTHKKRAKPAIQNLILCLCANPLMAEFWCLMGDVHYHLLNDFRKAKHFYENAIILGRNRLKNDKWPMEIAKYKAYPQKMIKSCEQILGTTEYYAKQS